VKNILAWSLLSAFFAVLVCLRIYYPVYNWDIVPYVGTVLAYDSASIEAAHAETYRLLAGKLDPAPAGHFSALIQDNPDYFARILPFYDIKPLYVGLIYSVSKFGISPVAAALSISTFAVIATCFMVFLWLKRFVSPLLSVGFTILLAFAAHLTTLATVATPDALSLLFVILGLYLWLEKNWLVVGMLLLIFSLTARLNNVIFICVLYSLLFFRYEHTGIRQRAVYLIALLGSINAYLLIKYQFNGYSWWTLFYHTFIELLPQPDTFSTPFSLALYGDVLVANSLTLLSNSMTISSSVYGFILLSVLVFQHGYQRVFIVTIWLSMAAHYLLFPQVEAIDRFFAPYYVLFTVFAVKLFAAKHHSQPST
jgi:hypothetical protein